MEFSQQGNEGWGQTFSKSDQELEDFQRIDNEGDREKHTMGIKQEPSSSEVTRRTSSENANGRDEEVKMDAQDFEGAASFLEITMGPKKKEKFKWNEKDMLDAIDAVMKKGMSCSKASQAFNVPRSTLTMKIKFPDDPVRKKMGPKCLLGDKIERRLHNWIDSMVKRGFPREGLDLTSSVTKIAEELKVNFHTSSTPGKKWLQLFKKRHSVRSQAEESSNDKSLSTEEGIRKWFGEVESYCVKKNLPYNDASRIFNVDECSFSLSTKCDRILETKGSKNQVFTGSDKETATVLFCVSAAGLFGPLQVVYSEQAYPKNVEKFLPENWSGAKSEKGWITGQVFYEYVVNCFHKWLTEQKIQLPVILYVDGHSSHLTLHLSEFASKHGIEFIALYPNHMQPLEVSTLGPLKKNYEIESDKWKKAHSTVVLEKHQLPMMLNDILKAKFNESSVLGGFLTCGLCPFSADGVDYSRTVVGVKIDPRHKHIESLLGPEMVASFVDGDEHVKNSPLYQLWLKSKEVCGIEDAPSNPYSLQHCLEDLASANDSSIENILYTGHEWNGFPSSQNSLRSQDSAENELGSYQDDDERRRKVLVNSAQSSLRSAPDWAEPNSRRRKD